MAIWFYYDEKSVRRSINDQQLKSLVGAGVITPKTPLETEDGHKGLAGQIPGLFAPVAPTTPSPFVQTVQVPIPPATGMSKKIITAFTKIVVGLAVGGGLLIFGIIAALITEDSLSDAGAVIGVLALFIGSTMVIYGTVYMYILLYRLWKIIPPDIARTTPYKAVGFCFIPFFNLYWHFVAFMGLGEDMNKVLQSQGIQHRVNAGLGMTASILFCISILPYIGFLTGLAGMIVLLCFYKSAKDGAIAMLEQGKR